MPVVRRTIAYRKSRRVRRLDDDDDAWESYDAALLFASPTLSVPEVKLQLAADALPVPEPQLDVHPDSTLNTELDVELVPDADVQLPDVSPGEHIPRPRNAFICFRSVYVQRAKEQAHLDSEAESKNQTTLSKDAGHAWHALSPAQRVPFERQAQREKEAHRKRHPGYCYAPGGRGSLARKPRKRSTPKTNAQTSAKITRGAPTSTLTPNSAQNPAPSLRTRRAPSVLHPKAGSIIGELDTFFSDAVALNAPKYDDDYTPNPSSFLRAPHERKERSKPKSRASLQRKSTKFKSKSARRRPHIRVLVLAASFPRLL
ncbi:hypothetical protein C8R45DRAFT_989234 [Mycena sanguinolenta]|nr:hypothetical protein C8R45DRAFT_989234 [Mycena sanguinolenta]